MQVNAVSLVAIAVWLAKAVDASALAARVTPVPDAALAHVLIKPLTDSNLCLTDDADGVGRLSSCNGDSSQIWTVNQVNGNIVQFQNAASNGCLSPYDSTIVIGSPCNDPASGRAYSNTQWLASQAISQAKLPMVLTGLDSQLGGVNTNACLAQNGGTTTYTTCNGGFSQSWALYAA